MGYRDRVFREFPDRYLVDELIYTTELYIEHRSHEYELDLNALKAELLRRLAAKKEREEG
jgi:hypothetical protein